MGVPTGLLTAVSAFMHANRLFLRFGCGRESMFGLDLWYLVCKLQQAVSLSNPVRTEEAELLATDAVSSYVF